jgi:hypothetical protein
MEVALPPRVAYAGTETIRAAIASSAIEGKNREQLVINFSLPLALTGIETQSRGGKESCGKN